MAEAPGTSSETITETVQTSTPPPPQQVCQRAMLPTSAATARTGDAGLCGGAAACGQQQPEAPGGPGPSAEAELSGPVPQTQASAG